MLVTYFVNFRQLNDHLFGKELFIRFTMSAFRKLPSIYVFSYFPFGFEGRMWDLIVSVPDQCLSFYSTPRTLACNSRFVKIDATALMMPSNITSPRFGGIKKQKNKKKQKKKATKKTNDHQIF